MSNINDYKIIFRVVSPHWDDNPGESKEAEAVTLGELIEYGMQTELRFKDGGYVQFEDLDWETDEVNAEISMS